MTLAEIDATTRKATRGCGCPWGLAEEAGKSARWLAAHGLPGAETLADMLAERPICCTAAGKPCVLRLGAALADRADALGANPIVIDAQGWPLVVLAQVGRAADTLDKAFALDWQGGGATVARHALAIHGAQDASDIACSALESAAGGRRPSPASQPVSEAEWAALTALSHRILVPASAASRAGAGAASGDND